MHPILRAFPRGLLSRPPRRACWRTEGLEPAKPGLGAPELVISRGRCRFGRFDLSRLPAARRAAALSLQLPLWSPFGDGDFAVAWSETGWATVWGWDRAELADTLEAQGLSQRGWRCLPESALQGAAEDGVRLLQGLDGVEAQYWQGGELLASRWWPAAPDVAAAIAFQRDCGLPADALLPTLPLQRAPLQDRPWTSIGPLGTRGGQIAPAEWAAYGLLALALGVPGLALAVEHLRLAQARSEARAELARESERSRGVMTSRDAALTSADQLVALRDLQPYPPPLVLMTAVARALPESDAAWVREWELNDGKLRLLLTTASDEMAGGVYVRALEQTGLFSDVKILTQVDPKQMGFTMNLRTQSALALDPSSPAASEAGASAPAAS